jgi:hypothetical protein
MVLGCVVVNESGRKRVNICEEKPAPPRGRTVLAATSVCMFDCAWI